MEMKSFRKRSAPLAALLFCLLCLDASSAEFEDSIVASVNGDPVTLYDIVAETMRSEFRKSTFMGGDELREQVLKKRRDVLDEIVNRKLFFADFKAKGYKLPPQYVETIIDDICFEVAAGDRKKLLARIEESGSTYEEFKEKIYEKAAVDVLVNELCRRTVNITPQTTIEYYRANPGDFLAPKKIELQIIFLDPKGKNKDSFMETVKEIEKDAVGADESIFATMAKLYSDGPGAADGGKSGWIEEKNIRDEFKSALGSSFEKGKVGKKTETEEGVYFIRICGVCEESEIPYENAEPEIMRKLSEAEFKKKYDTLVSKLREKAVLRYY